MASAKWERRKHPRFKTSILFNLHTLNSHSSPGRACITDISVGGLCLETNKNFEEGAVFNLRLPYREDTSPPSPLYGEVRWKKHTTPTYTYGVKFIALNFLERRCLGKYIQALLQGGKNGKEK